MMSRQDVRDPIPFPEGDPHRFLEKSNGLGTDRSGIAFHPALNFRNSSIPDSHHDLNFHGVNIVLQDAVEAKGLFVEKFAAHQHGATEGDHEFGPQIFTAELAESAEMEKLGKLT